MRPGAIIAITLLLALAAPGCSLRSRWALDDPDYQAKYGCDQHDAPLGRKIKRAVDGRWLGGKGGVALGAGGQTDPATVGGELEFFGYPESYLELHGGITGLGGTSADDFFGGGHFGARLQAPARVAPFIGFGTFGGWSTQTVEANEDGTDNDEDGWTDESDETETEIDNALAAVFPEVGVHVWTNSRVRVTGVARYMITTEGRDYDNWYFGVSIGYRPQRDEALIFAPAEPVRLTPPDPQPPRAWSPPEGNTAPREPDVEAVQSNRRVEPAPVRIGSLETRPRTPIEVRDLHSGTPLPDRAPDEASWEEYLSRAGMQRPEEPPPGTMFDRSPVLIDGHKAEFHP